jgi:ABC-type multidrug transport system ATPase subunit
MMHITSLKKTLGSFSLSIDNMEIKLPLVYGLIGPNGCGKSTAVKLFNGILQPDSGKIDTSVNSREITMVTQKPYIMNDTVYNNLVYPLKLRKIETEPLCSIYLEKAGLTGQKNQRARELSGGEKQKLALLRAMIFNPKIIILDESMTDLDLDNLDLFENMILERQKKDPIVWIIISHQLVQIRRLCDYIFFMSNGKLEAEGTTETLLQSDNPDVKRYLKHGFLKDEIFKTQHPSVKLRE